MGAILVKTMGDCDYSSGALELWSRQKFKSRQKLRNGFETCNA
jgi:hypothetical protein